MTLTPIDGDDPVHGSNITCKSQGCTGIIGPGEPKGGPAMFRPGSIGFAAAIFLIPNCVFAPALMPALKSGLTGKEIGRQV
jgi:hypothetical protein